MIAASDRAEVSLTIREVQKMSKVERDNKPYASIGAVGLIVIGVVFLLRNLGLTPLGFRWWGLFLILPAFYMLSSVWRIRQEGGGRLTPAARGTLIGALTLIGVGVVFMLELSWGAVWPIMLVIAGLAALLNVWM